MLLGYCETEQAETDRQKLLPRRNEEGRVDRLNE